MKLSYKMPLNTWLVAVAALLTVQHSAFAQNTEDGEDVPEIVIPEIIVTAQKRGEQNILEVPVAITVFDGDTLTETGANRLQEFLQQSPGVSISEQGQNPGVNDIQIRGISSGIGDNLLSGTATVGYYVDETVYSQVSRGGLPDSRTFDLERVEVLRGPQGTLYGAGAIGGVIRLITRDPDLHDVQFATSLGFFDIADGGNSSELNAALSLPIVKDKLAIRLVATQEDIDGYINGVAGSTPDLLAFLSGTPTIPLVAGGDLNDNEVSSWRLKILAQPTYNLRITAMHWDSQTGNGAYSTSRKDRTTDYTVVTNSDVEYLISNVTVTYDFNKFSLTSATSQYESTEQSITALLARPVFNNFKNEGFSQELRVNSTGDGRLNWVFGIFYQDQEQDFFQDAPALINAVFGVGDPNLFETSESSAIFADLSYDFSDKWSASLGLRYFEDERVTLDLTGIAPGTPAAMIPITSTDADTVNPRFGLSYTPDEDTNVYFNAGKGFRTGINTPPSALALGTVLGITLQPRLDDENLWSYEIGYKWASVNRALLFDAGAYFNDWTNLQQTVFLIENQLATTVNAGEATSKGLEAAFTARVNDRFSVGASAALTDGEFKDDVITDVFVVGVGVVPRTVFSEGTTPNGVPRVTANVWAKYIWTVGSYRMNAGFNINYRDSVTRAGIFAFEESGGPTIFSARVGFGNDRWTATLSAENLFDEDAAYAPGSDGIAYRARPRTIGIIFQYRTD